MNRPRALALAVILLGGAMLAASSASAAIIELPEGKIVERALDPGKDTLFTVPLAISQDGFAYVKLLVTPGNAVNDGTPNGSVSKATGWRVSYAFVRENGEREELGTYVDSSLSTPLVAVSNGEAPTLEVIVHVPQDAGKGGPSQKVYIAVAYRLDSGARGPGSASGATMDEARAVTLLLSNALLPPAQPTPEPEVPDPEVSVPTPEIPPVRPIDTGTSGQGTVVVIQQVLPTWFLAGALVVGSALTLTMAVIALVVVLIWRDLSVRRAQEPAVASRARTIPVSTSEADAAREFLEELDAAKTRKGLR